jgi:hypothetical protein
MKQVKAILENKNYAAVNVGHLNRLMGYSLIHPETQMAKISSFLTGL